MWLPKRNWSLNFFPQHFEVLFPWWDRLSLDNFGPQNRAIKLLREAGVPLIWHVWHVFELPRPRPLALRSSMAELISILTLPFRFMSGLLTCFTQAVYRHLLPSLSLVVASTCSLFLCCCVFLVCTSSTHLSTSFLFPFCSCLNCSRVFRWTKNQKLSNCCPHLWKHSNFLKRLLLLPSCFITLLFTLSCIDSSNVNSGTLWWSNLERKRKGSCVQ